VIQELEKRFANLRCLNLDRFSYGGAQVRKYQCKLVLPNPRRVFEEAPGFIREKEKD